MSCGLNHTKCLKVDYSYGRDTCDFCLEPCNKQLKCLRCPLHKRLSLCDKCFVIHSQFHTLENERLGGDFFKNVGSLIELDKIKNDIKIGNSTGLF